MTEKELIDVLDEKGNPSGLSEERQIIHKKGLWHKSIHIWIINSKKEILLQKRSSKTEVSAGCWTISVSGHVKAGQTPKEAAVEETKEELGIDLEKGDFVFLTEYKKSKYHPDKKITDNEFNPIFIVKKDVQIKDVKIDEKEVDEVKYVNSEWLKKMIESKKIKFKPSKKAYHKILFDYFDKPIK